MKTLLSIFFAVAMLTSTATFASSTDKVAPLTKTTAKELGLSKAAIDQIDELNQERNREIKIASIVYKNHPIMMESKINAANHKYVTKLQQIVPTQQFQAYLEKQ